MEKEPSTLGLILLRKQQFSHCQDYMQNYDKPALRNAYFHVKMHCK